MHTIILKTLGEMASFERAWITLAGECAQSVFQMPGWTLQWLRFFGHEVRPHCVLVLDGNKLIGLAPLMVSDRGGIKLLEFIGSFLNDYNAFLAPREVSEDVGTRIFTRLAHEPESWDLFKASAIENFKSALGVDGFESFGLRAYLAPCEQSPAFNLPNNWIEYLAGLPSKRVRSLESLRQQLVRKELCEYHVSTDPCEIKNRMGEFERNRLNSWHYRGRIHELPPLITTRRFSDFLKAVGSSLPESRGLHFASLRKGDRIVAAGLYFSANSRLVKYMQSWDCFYARYSPGTVLDWMSIRYAIEKGFKFFDFGQGDEEYKFKFGARHRPLQYAFIIRTDLMSHTKFTDLPALVTALR